MFDKKITFCAIKQDMVDVWPHPQPASRFIPDEYKKMARFDKLDMTQHTVKTCMPFLDSLSAGYIIPFDQDYLVHKAVSLTKNGKVEKTNFCVTPANKEPHDFGYHQAAQLPPKWNEISGGQQAGKFHNKWLIKTPPGYSCLFIKPMNRLEPRFEIISGIVDTDVYVNAINFPFILHKRDEQFLIKKGEPMVQVIPFKRESWKMWAGFYIEKLHSKTLNLLQSEWLDKYKKMFWHKKSFK